MNKLLEIALGVVTSIGGFLDAGTMAASAQAGARFGYSLLWALLLGMACIIFLVEMSGRLAAVSRHTLRDAVHKRFGLNFSLSLLAVSMILNLLVLACEIGGVSMALQLISGISLQWWVLPVAAAMWAVLWFGSFGVIEKGISIAGLITIAFIVGAWKLHPPGPDMLRGLLPSLPAQDKTNYWFTAVSILGANVSPYLMFFYSSGAVEEKWDQSHVTVNRFVAAIGMIFGASIAAGIVVVAARVLGPAGIRVDDYHQAALMLTPLWGWWGFLVFVLCLAIASFGAGVEVILAIAYELAQSFGWTWGKNKRARDEARFTLGYTAPILLASLIMVTGIEPLRLTMFTMALTCAALPLATFPFLVLLNDPIYMREHTNPRWMNYIVAGIVTLACILAVVALPLQIFGA
ncbi:MAG TPA: divalent metal cation transporter [Bryobacteraceae bacterium]|nr:divalent metal cation transporter [Bryobacteraceae bacterium]